MGQFVALSAGQDALLDIYTKSWPSEHSFESSPLFLLFVLHGFAMFACPPCSSGLKWAFGDEPRPEWQPLHCSPVRQNSLDTLDLSRCV